MFLSQDRHPFVIYRYLNFYPQYMVLKIYVCLHIPDYRNLCTSCYHLHLFINRPPLSWGSLVRYGDCEWLGSGFVGMGVGWWMGAWCVWGRCSGILCRFLGGGRFEGGFSLFDAFVSLFVDLVMGLLDVCEFFWHMLACEIKQKWFDGVADIWFTELG